MKYRYFALPKDSVSGTGEIRRDATEKFFALVRQVSGIDRSEAEAIIHSGRHIETSEFDIWARPINPFQPVRVAI